MNFSVHNRFISPSKGWRTYKDDSLVLEENDENFIEKSMGFEIFRVFWLDFEWEVVIELKQRRRNISKYRWWKRVPNIALFEVLYDVTVLREN